MKKITLSAVLFILPSLGYAMGSQQYIASCTVQSNQDKKVILIPRCTTKGYPWLIQFISLHENTDRIYQFGSQFDNGPIASIYSGVKNADGSIRYDEPLTGTLPLTFSDERVSIRCE